MIVSIHQPQYIPWLGYFEKIDRSDVFVFLDDVQFTKNDWQNRNKIRTSQGWQWVTVPVVHHLGQTIKETRLDDRQPWARKHSKAIETNYKKAPFFPEFSQVLFQSYEADYPDLSTVCLEFIQVLIRWLRMTTRTMKSSDLNLTVGPIESVPPTDRIGPSDRSKAKDLATRRLVSICKYFKADTYYSGAHGRDYLDLEPFKSANISVIFQEYRHPTYRQCFEPFIPSMSVVDLIMNEGPGALEIIRSGAQA